MLGELRGVLIVVVFAGGPHTAPRVELARQTLAGRQPAAVFLTGADFPREAAAETAALAAALPETPFLRDASRTTLESAWTVARRIRERYPTGATVLIVTSNYHAARAMWLVRGLLPGRYAVETAESADLRVRDFFRSRLTRVLLRGELVSWLYGFPVGLALRPLQTLGVLALGVAVMRWKRRRRAGRPAAGR
ncbi:MAG: YdcF family protein [Kiritimatiellae bacterium]|nr:YdcF family protein [Kiritimatiellia bacterium]